MFPLWKYLQWRLASRHKALKCKSLSPLIEVFAVQSLCPWNAKKGGYENDLSGQTSGQTKFKNK